MNEYVFLLRGPSGVARIKVQGTFLVLGRTSPVPLLRADRTISREHAVLVAAPGGIRIKDLGSANGVLLDGQRLDAYAEVPLDPGVRVSFGSTELMLLTAREATKPLDQAVDEVLIDENGTTRVLQSARAHAEPAPSVTEDGAQEESDEPGEDLPGDETQDELEEDEPDLAVEGDPDEWIGDALVPPEVPGEALPHPGKVTELDAELTELELPGSVSEVTELAHPADSELPPANEPTAGSADTVSRDRPTEFAVEVAEVSRDRPTELALENVLERGSEETRDALERDPEDERWREVERELADLE